MERNKWILVGTAAALLCGCDAKVKDDDGLGVGAKLSVDYLGDSDVVGFHYLIERVSCSPGDPIEPYAFEALVDLQDQLAPGGVTLLDVFDDASGHVFADVCPTPTTTPWSCRGPRRPAARSSSRPASDRSPRPSTTEVGTL